MSYQVIRNLRGTHNEEEILLRHVCTKHHLRHQIEGQGVFQVKMLQNQHKINQVFVEVLDTDKGFMHQRDLQVEKSS